ncbi:SRPBCC family protein [Paenarthrobacter sp. NPDC018779]|uniref:SRPBCC family protein n=1 Tax=Paenarthrobacter sp. NPDC018779 TaxID=3364375 RepID=UPI0037C5B616
MSTVTKVFDTTAAQVWDVIADGWLYSGWVVGASRIRGVEDQWPKAGSRLHHSVGSWPFLIDDSTSVTAAKPGQSLGLLARGWPMGEATVLITLEDVGEGRCCVSLSEDAVKGPGKLIPAALRNLVIGFRNRETLRRLELMAAGRVGDR